MHAERKEGVSAFQSAARKRGHRSCSSRFCIGTDNGDLLSFGLLGWFLQNPSGSESVSNSGVDSQGEVRKVDQCKNFNSFVVKTDGTLTTTMAEQSLNNDPARPTESESVTSPKDGRTCSVSTSSGEGSSSMTDEAADHEVRQLSASTAYGVGAQAVLVPSANAQETVAGTKSFDVLPGNTTCNADNVDRSNSSSPSYTVPSDLAYCFDPREVKAWDQTAWKFIRKLQHAPRNRGQVNLMCDVHENELVAVKKMPSSWVTKTYPEFLKSHPYETEIPWKDLGCTRFLESVGFPYVCKIRGMYDDAEHTYVVSDLATEGDMYDWCNAGIGNMPSGRQREAMLYPLLMELFDGVRRLHEFNIVHRDLSLENVLLTKQQGGALHVRICDFGSAMTRSTIFGSDRRCGKASYMAPEIHEAKEYDGIAADCFSLGVVMYAVLMKGLPWISTKTAGKGRCACFHYFINHGLSSYLKKRKVRGSNTLKVFDVLSREAFELLDGLLTVDPARRSTCSYPPVPVPGKPAPRSVWDEKWLRCM